jgi:peptidoglycan-associated lipoprotein
MRSKLLSQVILLALVASVGLTGCKSWNKKKDATTGGASDGSIKDLTPPTGIGSTPGAGERPPVGAQERGLFAPVLFGFDSAKVAPAEMAKLQAVATAMKSNSKALLIEGYADERGTAEYNRALGERRAQACREELITLGVPGSRMTTVSYGMERPADPGHDEAAWSKNRRSEFVLVAQ